MKGVLNILTCPKNITPFIYWTKLSSQKQLIFKAVFIYRDVEAVSIKVINMDVTIRLNHVDIVHFEPKGAFMALKHIY